MSPRLCIRLPWLNMTPFGLLVEPEVYWITASVSAEIFGARHSSPDAKVSASVDSQCAALSSGVCDERRSTSARMLAVVKTSGGRASLRMA